MHEINHLPPERMTPEQRRREVASLLANGLVRLRSPCLSGVRKWPARERVCTWLRLPEERS